MSEPTPKVAGPIEYDLNADDLTAFNLEHYKSSRVIARQLRFTFVVAFCVMMTLPVLVVKTSEEPLVDTLRGIWPLLLGPVLLLALGPWYVRRRGAMLARKVMKEGASKGSFGPHLLSWDALGLREQSPRGETMRKWESIERIARSETHLFLYTSSFEAIVVPLRAFRSQAETDAFVKEVAAHTGAEPVGSV